MTVLSENCPKCGQQMFNHPRSITRCAKCGHEWSMKESEAPFTSKEITHYDIPTVLRGEHKQPCACVECRAADEIERLTRERDDAQAEWAALSQDDGKVERALERVESERDRLRAVLRDALAECLEENGQDLTGEHWSSRAEALLPDVSGEPPAHETAGDWLTNEQCDDVIAFLEDYEWTGLTRENVRTWCTAIAEARSSVKASGEPT